MMVDARPLASAVMLVVATPPPVVIARKLTLTPGTGRLSAACTSTTIGWGNGVPAPPVCASPLMITRWVGTGTTASFALADIPSGVVAVSLTLPRFPSVATEALAPPVDTTVATDGPPVVHG